MSLRSRAAETFIPLTVACEQAGYATDRTGQRALRRQLTRKGFEVRRLGHHFSLQVATWQAYLKRCEQDDAAYRAKMGAYAKTRWAAKTGECLTVELAVLIGVVVIVWLLGLFIDERPEDDEDED